MGHKICRVAVVPALWGRTCSDSGEGIEAGSDEYSHAPAVPELEDQELGSLRQQDQELEDRLGYIAHTHTPFGD